MRKVAKVKRKLQAKFCVKEHWLHHGMNMQQTSKFMTCFVFRKQKSAVCTTQLDLKNLDGMQYTQHFSFHMDYFNTYRWDPLLSWLPIFQHTLPDALVHHFCWFNSHSCNVCFFYKVNTSTKDWQIWICLIQVCLHSKLHQNLFNTKGDFLKSDSEIYLRNLFALLWWICASLCIFWVSRLKI